MVCEMAELYRRHGVIPMQAKYGVLYSAINALNADGEQSIGFPLTILISNKQKLKAENVVYKSNK